MPRIQLLKISKSPIEHKKYRADVIIDGTLYRNIDFGDTRYEQYYDRTPLKLYKHMNHRDKKRRESYLARHAHDHGPAGILARYLLW